MTSKFPHCAHVPIELVTLGGIPRAAPLVNWRPAVGPGPIVDPVIREAAKAQAVQRGRSRTPGMLHSRLVRNKHQVRSRRRYVDIACRSWLPHHIY
jgi:hypothetical protein